MDTSTDHEFFNHCRSKIIQSLIVNQQVKIALKTRILRECSAAQIKISRAYRQRQLRLNAKRGVYYATLYLETEQEFTPSCQVYVFGEFSTPSSWQEWIPCRYDHNLKVFKVDIKLKIGHNFKFMVKRNHDQLYIVSNRYNVISDGFGHLNNVYDPKKINWLTEKKQIMTKFSSPNRRS